MDNSILIFKVFFTLNTQACLRSVDHSQVRLYEITGATDIHEQISICPITPVLISSIQQTASRLRFTNIKSSISKRL